MQFLSINGHIIHYKFLSHPLGDRGKGSITFLFINSLGTDFRIWNDIVEKVQPYGNVLLFDKRGHGLSDVVEDTGSLEDFMNDAFALLQYLSIKKCTVIGISVGGIIAQLMAHHRPEMIDKLILCDTRHKIADAEFWNKRIETIKANGLNSISGDLMKRWFAPSFHIVYPAKVAGYKNMLERTSLTGYVQTCAAIRDADTTEIAKKIAHKTLCIVGSEDLSTTVEEVKSLHTLIPGSAFEVIENSGHLPCVDNPEMLSKLIIDFIKV